MAAVAREGQQRTLGVTGVAGYIVSIANDWPFGRLWEFDFEECGRRTPGRIGHDEMRLVVRIRHHFWPGGTIATARPSSESSDATHLGILPGVHAERVDLRIALLNLQQCVRLSAAELMQSFSCTAYRRLAQSAREQGRERKTRRI